MEMTWNELLANLRSLDEISLMEALEITSEDLVEQFIDRIEERSDKLKAGFSEESDY